MFNKYQKFIEKELEEAKEEIKRLRKENSNLQAALVARDSPMAYEHYAKEYPEDNNRKQQEQFNAVKRYTDLMEGPLFESADEMIHSLGTAMGVPKSTSIHKNNES